MIAYLDIVFITGVILFDSEDIISARSLVALLVLLVTFFIPLSLLFYLFAKFDQLQTKEGKEKLNSLLLKVDKGSRIRIFLPCFFFFRRFATAVILVLGATENAPSYVQFAVIVLLSAIKMFYIAKEEPYVIRRINKYVFSMELIYFILAITAFCFTDATADLDLKKFVAVICLVMLILFILSNLLTACYFARKGRSTLRELD